MNNLGFPIETPIHVIVDLLNSRSAGSGPAVALTKVEDLETVKTVDDDKLVIVKEEKDAICLIVSRQLNYLPASISKSQKNLIQEYIGIGPLLRLNALTLM